MIETLRNSTPNGQLWIVEDLRVRIRDDLDYNEQQVTMCSFVGIGSADLVSDGHPIRAIA